MTIKEMHYDFKQKLNKIDSQKYRNLLVPEIDWKLNEAQELFIKLIAEPRSRNGNGFEISQRSIDDIKSIVVNQEDNQGQIATKLDDKSYLVELPSDYMFYVSSKAICSKGKCKNKILSTHPIQHDDDFEKSLFDEPNFEWREVVLRFMDKGIKVFTDSTFEVNSLRLNYIKHPAKLHNAEDAPGGTYRDLGTGLLLTGTQDCILDKHTHREIVDIAVLIATGDLQISDYQIKINKIKLT